MNATVYIAPRVQLHDRLRAHAKRRRDRLQIGSVVRHRDSTSGGGSLPIALMSNLKALAITRECFQIGHKRCGIFQRLHPRPAAASVPWHDLDELIAEAVAGERGPLRGRPRCLGSSSSSAWSPTRSHAKGRISKPAPIRRLRIAIARSAAPGVSLWMQSERKRPSPASLTAWASACSRVEHSCRARCVARACRPDGRRGRRSPRRRPRSRGPRRRAAALSPAGQQLQVPVDAGDGCDDRIGIDAIDGGPVVERAVRLDVADDPVLKAGLDAQRRDLLNDLLAQRLGIDLEVAPAESLAVEVRDVCADALVPQHGLGADGAHRGGVAGVEAAGDVALETPAMIAASAAMPSAPGRSPTSAFRSISGAGRHAPRSSGPRSAARGPSISTGATPGSGAYSTSTASVSPAMYPRARGRRPAARAHRRASA